MRLAYIGSLFADSFDTVLCTCVCRYVVHAVANKNVKRENSAGAHLSVILSSWSSLRQSSFCYHLSRHHRRHVYVVSVHWLFV